MERGSNFTLTGLGSSLLTGPITSLPMPPPDPPMAANGRISTAMAARPATIFFETFFATVTWAGSYPSFLMVTTVSPLSGTKNVHGVAPVIPLDNVTRAPVGSEFMKRVSLVVPHPEQKTINTTVSIFIALFISPLPSSVLVSLLSDWVSIQMQHRIDRPPSRPEDPHPRFDCPDH